MIKSKFKILSIILMLVLFMLPSTTLNVQASDGSGTSTDGDKANASAVGGPSHNKTGWLVYVMNEKTNSLQAGSSVVFMYCNNAPTKNAVGNVTTRFGDVCTEDHGQAPSYVLEPFTNEGKSNGSAMKEYLVTDTDGQSGAIRLIEKVWGVSFAEELASDANWVLCMEGVYWYDIYLGGQNSGISYIGTAQMIGTMQQNPVFGGLLQPQGDYWINKLTNGWFALCAMVEPNAKLGIKYPTNTSSPKINNDLMASEGYGMIQAWPTDGEMIPTYDGIISPGILLFPVLFHGMGVISAPFYGIKFYSYHRLPAV